MTTDTKTMTWLPMSEAPRDKRIIAWHTFYKDWFVVRPHVGTYPWIDDSDGDVYAAEDLTHWLPIDPPH